MTRSLPFLLLCALTGPALAQAGHARELRTLLTHTLREAERARQQRAQAARRAQEAEQATERTQGLLRLQHAALCAAQGRGGQVPVPVYRMEA